MEAEITQLAKMMRARRAAGVAPYTLLLGSSLSLTPAVRCAVCDSEDWEAFWETVSCTSPEERRALMHGPLSRLDLQPGCDALAQLVGAGYFSVVLTLNLDDALDNALKMLPASEYRILVHGLVTSLEIVAALDRPTPRIKVVKLRGDVNTYKLPLTPEATFVFPPDLEEALARYLRHDTVIVGDLPFDDDVQRCIRGGDGALWVIAAEGNGFLGRAKRTRKVGKAIAVTEFNAFFTALVEALGLGETEEAAPEMAFVPPEKRINPYRGLEPFEPEHARYFFGREVLAEILVERLRNNRFLAVLGASGSGKSSVVRAGVLPALAQDKLPGSGNWPVLVMKPGQNPQEALAGALVAMVGAARGGSVIDYARLQQMRQEIQERLLHEESALHELATEIVHGPRTFSLRRERSVEPSPTKSDDRRVVVVIDQFEELFTLCPFEQRQRFIDALLYAVGQPEGRTTVLLTLRADFVAQCTAYPDLSDLISSHQVWVRAMDDEGLRAAIELPAWAMGMRFEPGLVPLILADVGREPGALPLLEDALWSLFEYCCEGDEVIELRQYREIGGVQGALAKRADDVYAALSAEEQEVTRRILLQLVEMRATREPIRRRATLNELITTPEERAPVEKVVQRLTDARLLTTTRDVETGHRVVDISHEALIRGWPRLREWLEEDWEDLLTYQRLREAAAEWERGKRHESYLYRGAQLAKVVEWHAAHEGERRPEPCRRVVEGLNELEQAFVDASVEMEERAAREEEARRQRELEQAQALAEEQRRRAEEQARAAEALKAERDRAEQQARFARSGQLAAQSQIVLEKYPPRSLLLAVEALNITMQAGEPRVPAAEDALRQALANSGGRGLGGHQAAIYAIAISPDNHWLATGSDDRTARLWDLTAPDPAVEPIVLRGHKGPISTIAISPDSRWLVTGSWDNTARLWDLSALLKTGLTADDPAAGPIVLRGHEGSVSAVAISPDNHRLVTSGGSTARLWDLTTEDPAAAPIVLRGHESFIEAVAISPDNHWLVTGSLDKTARLWDLTSPDPAAAPIVLRGHEGPILAVAISLDNHWLVTGSRDKTARLWDLTVRDFAEPIVLRGHEGHISAVAISPDSHWLVTGSGDNTARLWDLSALLKTGLTAEDPAAAPIVLRGHEGYISAVAISPDNHWLATGSGDNTAHLWDLTALDSTAEPIVLHGHSGPIIAAAISPDNHWLVTSSDDKTTRLWDLTTEDLAAAPIVLRGHEGYISAVAISPDNHWLVISGGNTALLWDLAVPDPAAAPIVLRGHEGYISAVVISPDNGWLVTGSGDNTARLWDLTAPDPAAEPIVLRGHEGYISAVAISPDNHWLVTSGGDTALLWDLTAEDPAAGPIVLRGHKDWITAVAINADSRWLVTSDGNTALLWSLTVPDPAAGPIVLRGHEDWITAVAISPDSRWLVTGGLDATLWDLNDPDPAVEPIVLRGHEGLIDAVAISPDSRWLVTRGGNTALLWDLTVPDPAAAPTALRGHDQHISAVAISSDNHWLVTVSVDATARLWDLTAGDPAATPIILRGHEGHISAVAISPDNHWLVTGSDDDTARLWDLTDPAAAPIVLRGHEDEITTVVISPNNHWLITGSRDKTARLWNLRLNELIDLACRTAGRNLTRAEWEQYLPGQRYRKTCEQWPLEEERV